MIYYWESWEFEYKDFEIKLSRYTNDYHVFEIEAKKGHDPNSLANELNLHPYTEKEYREAIIWENENIHRIYRKSTAGKMLRILF